MKTKSALRNARASPLRETSSSASIVWMSGSKATRRTTPSASVAANMARTTMARDRKPDAVDSLALSIPATIGTPAEARLGYALAALRVGVPKESREGERRVALIPDAVRSLAGKEVEVAVESGAGEGAGHPDAEYSHA